MNKYEGVFIFFPDVEEEKRNQTFDRVKAIIEADGAIDEKVSTASFDSRQRRKRWRKRTGFFAFRIPSCAT